MKYKWAYAYGGLLVLVVLSYLLGRHFPDLLIPVYLVAVSLALRKKINLSLSFSDLAFTLAVSAVVLIPFYLIFPGSLSFRAITFPLAARQFFTVAVPEELFFRGCLQEELRNDMKSIFIVSALFSAAHLPALFFRGDLSAPLTFLPSLVMGFLYRKTSNVLPPAVFHLISNVTFSGFVL